MGAQEAVSLTAPVDPDPIGPTTTITVATTIAVTVILGLGLDLGLGLAKDTRSGEAPGGGLPGEAVAVSLTPQFW